MGMFSVDDFDKNTGNSYLSVPLKQNVTDFSQPISLNLLGSPANSSTSKAIGSASLFERSQIFFSIEPNTYWYEFSAIDIDGDGDKDIIAFLSLYPFQNLGVPIKVLLNDGSGGFADGTSKIFPNGAPLTVHPRGVVSKDFNGDGRPDIFVADHGYDTSPYPGFQNTLLLSSGTSGFVDATNRLPLVSDFSHSTTAGDINGDGHDDILVLNTYGGSPSTGELTSPYILLNDGLGHFVRRDNLLPDDIDNRTDSELYTASLLFDADGDGDLDLFLGQWLAPNSRVLINDGSGNFNNSNPIELPPGPWGSDNNWVMSAKTIDLNGDGKLDLIVNTTHGYNGHYLQFLINNGSGKWLDETDQRLPQSKIDDGFWINNFNLVDLNGDGFLDLITRDKEWSPVYINDGTGKFIHLPSSFLDVSGFGTPGDFNVIPLDANGDGRLDLILQTNNGWMYVFKQTDPGPSQTGTDQADGLLGDSSDESISGLGGDDVIFGGAGNDTLWGGDGDDVLVGGSGTDLLNGGAGNDSLDGGAGDDTLAGDAGDDVYVVNSVADTVTELASGGTDEVRASIGYTLGANLENLTLTGSDGINGNGNSNDNVITGNSGMNTLFGGAGNDTLYGGGGYDTLLGSLGNDLLNGGEGFDIAFYGDITTDLTLNMNLAMAVSSSSTGNDTFVSIEGVVAGSGNDTITGDAGNNYIEGGAGNNRIDGGAGRDLASYRLLKAGLVVDLSTFSGSIATALGTDTLINMEGIVGSQSDDIIKGGNGFFYLMGGLGNDTISGSSADDILEGNEGNDTLAGGDGNDTLYGDNADPAYGPGYGNDVLSGGSGNDILYGGVDNDTISGDAGDDIMNGGDGTDTLSYAGTTFSVTVSLAIATAQDSKGAGIDTISGFENLTGGSGNDLLTGNVGNNVIDGGLGLDVASFAGLTTGLEIDLSNFSGTITTALGTDTLISIEGLIGGSGNDVLKAGATATYLDGGAGNDFLGGSAFADTLIGGAGDDGIAAGAGNDSLDGGDGDDTLLGQAGDDTISGGLGADFIDAGDGIDTVNAGDANDLINGGNGNDIINGDAGNDSIYGDAGNDVIDGGFGDDDLSGGNDNDTITGGAGDDRIAGGFGNDILNGGDGNDTISANDGDDTITGGLGVDNLYGFTGNDNIDGGASNDTLLGMEGDDTVTGGAGADYIVGGDGIDTLYGDDGDDNMQGNDGADTLSGGLGNDGLDGGAGNDTLNGDAGNDYLGGGEGNDTLNGGDGNDVFVGGAGKDTLTGGAGADAFFFTALTDSTSAATDKITDFSWANGDYINLSQIDANSAVAGDQAFSFVNSFTKQAGQATLSYDAASNTSTFSADVDGDGVADFVLQITGQLDTSNGWVL